MRPTRLLFSGLVAILFAWCVVSSDVQRRDTGSTSAPLGSTQTVPASNGAKSASPSPVPKLGSSGPTGLSQGTTDTLSATNSPSFPSVSQTAAPSSSSNQADVRITSYSVLPEVTQTPNSSNNTSPINPNPLPIKSSLTPGLAVAGVILMISGAVYTLIGIKNKRLHIFLSAAFLTGLSIVVLIIYVMNPPVSRGIQGAYVLAAVATGLIFGGVSIVFPEVTEGLGCLLGGFCLSMWFLVLKPGGLITATGSKVIMIAAFSLSVFALSFSHWTRDYGLIGSISFAGATIFILGIDCFSGAGLKEFWLYVWALNDNVFPLHTTTFPQTKGTRVEIAAIILLSIVGIISQLKLWRIIQERRAWKEEERMREERDLEAVDEYVGRRVEKVNNRARAQWEAAYGDNDIPGQGAKQGAAIASAEVGSGKGSTSSSETIVNRGSREDDEIEMINIEGSGSQPPSKRVSRRRSKYPEGPTVTVRVASEDGHQDPQVEEDGEPLQAKQNLPSARGSVTSKYPSGSTKVSSPVIGQENSTPNSRRTSAQSSVPPPPPIVPLPFTIPTAPGSDNEEDNQSVATFADSQHEPVRRKSKRTSGMSTLKSFSSVRVSRAYSGDEESLIIPHIEDDRASSIAATIDDLAEDAHSLKDDPHVATPQNEVNIEGLRTFGLTLGALSPKQASELSTGWPSRPRSIAVVPATHAEDPSLAINRPLSMTDLSAAMENLDDKRATKGISRAWFTEVSGDSKADSKGEEETSLTAPGQAAKSPKLGAPSVFSGHESLAANLSEQLPRRVSKVVMSYRTNEWAKHLDAAEKPELDDLNIVDCPEDVQVEEAKEVPRPVQVQELQQTPDNARPPPAVKKVLPQSSYANGPLTTPISRPTSKHASRVSIQERPPSQPIPTSSFYQQALPRTASKFSVQQGSSANTSISHLPQTQPTNFPISNSPVMVHRGMRSSSAPYLTQPFVDPLTEDHSNAAILARKPSMPVGNTLLSQRESLIQNKHSFMSLNHLPMTPEPAILPTSSNDSNSAYNHRVSLLSDNMPLRDRRDFIQQQTVAAVKPPPGFDSHQPARMSQALPAEKREAMLASWRESVRQDLAQSQQANFSQDARRSELFSERQQALLGQRQQAMASASRDHALDKRMRQVDMNDLHKEALRKMQADANKHI